MGCDPHKRSLPGRRYLLEVNLGPELAYSKQQQLDVVVDVMDDALRAFAVARSPFDDPGGAFAGRLAQFEKEWGGGPLSNEEVAELWQLHDEESHMSLARPGSGRGFYRVSPPAWWVSRRPRLQDVVDAWAEMYPFTQ